MKFKKPKSIESRKPKRHETASHDKSGLLPYGPRLTPNEPLVVISGPLATIRRVSKEACSRNAALLDQLGGDDVIRVVAAMLSRENTACDIALAVWHFHAWYSAAMLGDLAASALRPNIVPEIEAAVQTYCTVIFEELAKCRSLVAYRYMRAELERHEASLRMIGIIPLPVVLGNYWTTRRVFMREFGVARAASVENQALMSAIKVLAHCSLASSAPDFRPPRAHEYVVGMRECADWFLASEVDVAIRREDCTRAKELIMDPGTFNQNEWQPEHLFGYGEILAQPNWKTADAPLHYIPSAVSKTLKTRRLADHRDQINARRAGLVRVEAQSEEDQDDPLEQVIARDGYFEDEIMAQHDLKRICDLERVPAELRTVVAAKYSKRKNDRLGETPLLSQWPEQRIASANQLLKADEKWGKVLRGSEALKVYSATPTARRYGVGSPQTPARPGRRCACGLMTKKEAARFGHQCNAESKRLAEFLRAKTESVFGKRLGSFASSRFHPQVHAPTEGAASEVRILVQDGKVTGAGEVAGIKLSS